MEQNFKPILFSTPMVQAILEGRKTQTRRSVIKQPTQKEFLPELFNDELGVLYVGYKGLSKYLTGKVKSRYQQGDILWVRETWHKVHDSSTRQFLNYGYKANWSYGIYSHPKNKGIWNASIHMPKDAARIFLEVTNVRCERLNDISENDAIAEGIETFYNEEWDKISYKDYLKTDNTRTSSPIHSFASLWRSINGKDSWELNPFVWVYEFKLIDKPNDWPL